MGKSKGRNPFPRAARTLTREDILCARWLLGEVVDMTDTEIMDILNWGAAMLVGIGRERPLELQTCANLLCDGDVEMLRRAVRK